MAKKYVIGNFKGGVGKSTCAQMLGFESAVKEGKRTLIIDLDMQGNTSDDPYEFFRRRWRKCWSAHYL